MSLIPAIAHHNTELQVYRSIVHMYSCKIIYYFLCTTFFFINIHLCVRIMYAYKNKHFES